MHAYRRVVGWEAKASVHGRPGGGSDVSLREPTGDYACITCIDRLKSGLNVGQEALL